MRRVGRWLRPTVTAPDVAGVTGGRGSDASWGGVPDRLDMPLRSWAAEAPDDLAVVCDDGEVSAAALVGRIDAWADWCASSGAPGDRVALACGAGLDALVALYAVPASGRVLVPLNIRHSPGELCAQVRRAGVSLLVGTADLVTPIVAGLEAGLGTSGSPTARDVSVAAVPPPPGATGDQGKNGSSGPLVAYRVEADHSAGRSAVDAEAAWVIFTSGTTGPPKGVLCTAASLGAAVATTAAGRPLADDEVYLYPFPLYHVAAYNVVHAHWRRRPVVLPGRFDAAGLVALTERWRVTAMSLAPTMLRMVLDELATRPAETVAAAMGSLRTVNYGAAPMSPSLLAEAVAVLGCDFAQGYGMTELSGNAVFLSGDAHRRGLAGEPELLRAAGYAGVGVDVRVVDEQGLVVPAGVTGEVVVRGAQVCAGYLDDPVATASTIRDGWLHTGDLGTLRADGLLRIVDRAKDIVVTGGENVAAREVEDVIVSHPAVAQVAVVGVTDAHWGEAVTAVVVPADGVAPPSVDVEALTEALRAHVGSVLAGYKKPRRVVVVEALPVNAGGKVDKRRIRAWIERGQTGEL